jgi:putative monooxygenase
VPIVRQSELIPQTTFPGVVRRGITNRSQGIQAINTGVTRFEPGAEVKLHYHNCDEVIVIIEGEAECRLAGEIYRLRPLDTAVVPAGQHHAFRNPGAATMAFIFVYPQFNVERTLVE